MAASVAGLLFVVPFTMLEGNGLAWTSPGEGETRWSTWTQVIGFLAVAALPSGLLAFSTLRTPTGVRALGVASGVYCTLGLAAWAFSESMLPGAVWNWGHLVLRRMLADEAALLLWVPRVLPAVLLVFVVLLMWLNLAYSRWFTGRQGKGDDLCTWALPSWVMSALMLCIACVLTQVGWLQPFFQRSELILVLASNGLVIGFFLYWLQGVAVANYYFFRLRLSPLAKCLGLGLQAVFMVLPASTAMFAVAGLVDAWFDLRRLRAHDEIGIER